MGSMSPTTKNLTSLNISSGTFSSSSSADMVPAASAAGPPRAPSPISPALTVEKPPGPGSPVPSPRRAAEPREQGARCGTHHPPPGRRGGGRGRGEPPGQSGSPRPISHPRYRRTAAAPDPPALSLLLPLSPNRTGSQHPGATLPPHGTRWTRPERQRRAAGIPGPAHWQTGEGRGEGSAPPSSPACRDRPRPRPLPQAPPPVPAVWETTKTTTMAAGPVGCRPLLLLPRLRLASSRGRRGPRRAEGSSGCRLVALSDGRFRCVPPSRILGLALGLALGLEGSEGPSEAGASLLELRTVVKVKEESKPGLLPFSSLFRLSSLFIGENQAPASDLAWRAVTDSMLCVQYMS